MAKERTDIVVKATEIAPLFERCLLSVREDMRDNAYILEGLRVLPVGGFRSAIGAFWNAVVDDLRNKVMFRSLSLFKKALSITRELKTYEDLQEHINDDQLIDGAYAIGVIGWEAKKILRHCKETRHIFSGHPKSGEPSPIKVLAMMDDCIRYVLNAEYPPQIIDIDEYLGVLGSKDFARNAVAVENAFTDLPELYKVELVNRLYSSYVHPESSTILRSNIEFVVPTLWKLLPKETKIQVVRRVDQEISKGAEPAIDQGFAFVGVVDATGYLSATARRYKLQPLVTGLKESLDMFAKEDGYVSALEPYASVIPPALLKDYVWGLTHTYVGHVGGSAMYSRTDFYANGAAVRIPGMFQSFDDRAAEAFAETIRESRLLQERISSPKKLRRLRSLANIVLEKASSRFAERELLEALADETKEEEFLKLLRKSRKAKE